MVYLKLTQVLKIGSVIKNRKIKTIKFLIYCSEYFYDNIYQECEKTYPHFFERKIKKKYMSPFQITSVIQHFQKRPPEVFYKKKLCLKISQYSLENTCVEVSF